MNVDVTKRFEGKYIFYSFRKAAAIAFLPVGGSLSPRPRANLGGENPGSLPPDTQRAHIFSVFTISINKHKQTYSHEQC